MIDDRDLGRFAVRQPGGPARRGAWLAPPPLAAAAATSHAHCPAPPRPAEPAGPGHRGAVRCLQLRGGGGQEARVGCAPRHAAAAAAASTLVAAPLLAAMSTFVGGKLKLKGGVDPSQLKGGVKKKKKKAAAADALAVVPADGDAAAGGAGGDQQAQVRRAGAAAGRGAACGKTALRHGISAAGCWWGDHRCTLAGQPDPGQERACCPAAHAHAALLPPTSSAHPCAGGGGEGHQGRRGAGPLGRGRPADGGGEEGGGGGVGGKAGEGGPSGPPSCTEQGGDAAGSLHAAALPCACRSAPASRCPPLLPFSPPPPTHPPTHPHPQAEAHFLKHEAERAKKIAAKSHRERIKELNEVGGVGGWGGWEGEGEGRL